MPDHDTDTINAVMAHMRCTEEQAIGYLECCNDQTEIDAITGYGPRERDEYQEHRDRQLTEGECDE